MPTHQLSLRLHPSFIKICSPFYTHRTPVFYAIHRNHWKTLPKSLQLKQSKTRTHSQAERNAVEAAARVHVESLAVGHHV